MNKRLKFAGIGILCIILIIAAVVYFKGVDVSVLNPQGEVADKERNLIVFTLLLSAVVVIPVFTLLAVFALKYKEGNEKAVYRPNWDSNRLLETIWWGIPCAIILTLGIVTWRTTHELDPYQALNSNVQPINVQVVALQWKWLFIYPDQHVASVNFLQFPEKTPVNFSITADAPMNSFWIPSLGGQIYAMSGMSTKLHLVADKTGDYRGSSANISGKGFSDMRFTARSSSRADFDKWVKSNKESKNNLDMASYAELAKPGTTKDPIFYSLGDPGIYDNIIMKYMTPEQMKHMDMSGMEGM